MCPQLRRRERGCFYWTRHVEEMLKKKRQKKREKQGAFWRDFWDWTFLQGTYWIQTNKQINWKTKEFGKQRETAKTKKHKTDKKYKRTKNTKIRNKKKERVRRARAKGGVGETGRQ